MFSKKSKNTDQAAGSPVKFYKDQSLFRVAAVIPSVAIRRIVEVSVCHRGFGEAIVLWS